MSVTTSLLSSLMPSSAAVSARPRAASTATAAVAAFVVLAVATACAGGSLPTGPQASSSVAAAPRADVAAPSTDSTALKSGYQNPGGK